MEKINGKIHLEGWLLKKLTNLFISAVSIIATSGAEIRLFTFDHRKVYFFQLQWNC